MENNPAVHDQTVMHAKRLKIRIVESGIKGLTLGAILEKPDILYELFKRAPEIKPLDMEEQHELFLDQCSVI
ncbi:hypothetical protein BGX24_011066 [Mortierella sp. AD032]|nr:hypothetical protein BGX24_011066 [Mortierella sp. AD032]